MTPLITFHWYYIPVFITIVALVVSFAMYLVIEKNEDESIKIPKYDWFYLKYSAAVWVGYFVFNSITGLQ